MTTSEVLEEQDAVFSIIHSLWDGVYVTTAFEVMSAPTIFEDASNVHYQPTKPFSFFPSLQDELQLAILSFVADAPFEKDPTGLDSSTSSPVSMLTHTLPLVSQKFRKQFCDSNMLWKDALVRQLKYHEPKLWKDALLNLFISNSAARSISIKDQEEVSDHETVPELVERTFQALSKWEVHSFPSQERSAMSYKTLYQRILNEQLRYVGPVFIMSGDVVLGQSYGLHLFEYRYRYMIRSIMSHQKQRISASRNGVTEKGKQPVYFIHANRGNVRRSEMAVLVQVMHCQIYPDGRADIVVLPVHHVWIERSWLYDENNSIAPQRPVIPTPPNNLFYAQCLKMGQAATSAMNHLQRQETLANLMDRLITSGMILSSAAVMNDQEDDTNDEDDHTMSTTAEDSGDE